MAKTYEQMTKAELLEAITFLKLEDTVEAKDANAPTNAELKDALNKFKGSQADANPEAAKAAEVVEKSKDKLPARTADQLISMQVEDLYKSRNYIVTDHEANTVVEEDEDRRIIELRWGNPMLGMTTSRVVLHGQPQLLQNGLVKAMRRIKMPGLGKSADGKETANMERKRFSITETEGWTQDKLDAHKEAQKLKKL